MQCQEARELLDSFLAEELLVETNHDLLRHLSGCPDCTAELDGRNRMRAGLKAAFARTADLQLRPEFARELPQGLMTSGRATSHHEGRWSPRWVAVAAAVLVAAGLSAYMLRARIPDSARVAASDHQYCAVKFALKERPISLLDAAARFDPAYKRLETTPPDTVQTGAGTLHVVDRHSCVFNNRRFGHVVLRLGDHLVSVLMTRDDAAPSSPDPHALSWLPRVNGYAMASTHTPGHTVYLVSDLDDSVFRQVATSLADPVSQLARLTVVSAGY